MDMHDNYQKYRSKARGAIKKATEAIAISHNAAFRELAKDERAELMSEHAIDVSSDEFYEIISAIDFGTPEEEWDRKEILLSEREVLGRSVSGSLHEVFKSFFTGGSMVTPLSQVASLNENTRIKIEAIIKTKIKEF
jgi:hypothetical protein